ncbi:MAG: phosphoglycerate kinase [Clostridia bacterium]|nr:phosphoglycerate kinase [Clostridia bacterium]
MKQTVEDLDVGGKRVLVRCDFNVPQDEKGAITDDRRIREALKTIRYLMEHDARVILCSHLGRPKGEVNPKYSLKPIAVRLSELLGVEVKMAEDVIGESAHKLAENLKDREVMLIENVRYDAREEKNDPEFSKELASLAELYVNDAFGTAHRAHSSTAGVADYLPSAVGYLIKKEIDIMGKALENPERPFVAILGGKKVSDKISVIENLIDKVDSLIIGGGMSYTFFKAQGKEIGKSICEDDKIDLAKELLAKAEEKGVRLILPVDNVVVQEFSNEAPSMVVSSDEIPEDYQGVDVGPKTLELYAEVLRDAKTVVWNGPVGVFEFDNFAKGTNKVAEILAGLEGATTIIGGGDSAAAIEKGGFADKMTHISTGGGASLEFLEGKVLPGIDCITDKE